MLKLVSQFIDREEGPSYRSVIGVALVALVLCGYWLASGGREMDRMKGMRAVIMSKSQELNRLRLNRLQLQQSEEKLVAARQDLRDLRQSLTENAQVHIVVGRLHELALKHGIEINQVQPGGKTQEDGVMVTPLTLRGTGSYPKICALFDELRLYNRTFRIDTVTMDVEEKGDASCRFTISLSLFSMDAPTEGKKTA